MFKVEPKSFKSVDLNLIPCHKIISFLTKIFHFLLKLFFQLAITRNQLNPERWSVATPTKATMQQTKRSEKRSHQTYFLTFIKHFFTNIYQPYFQTYIKHIFRHLSNIYQNIFSKHVLIFKFLKISHHLS